MKKVLFALLVVVLVCTLASCVVAEKAIVGVWKNQTTVLGVVTEKTYTFNEDGSGKITNVVDIPFTYEFSDGKLIITTSVLGIKSSEEYTYKFGLDDVTLTGEKEELILERTK